MRLDIVTPEAQIYSEEVGSVVLPTLEGEVGILPGHIPLMTALAAGELSAVRYANGSGSTTTYFAVDKGFAQIVSDRIMVLSERAVDVASIDLESVAQERIDAEKALAEAREQKWDPSEIEHLETRVRFAIVQQLTKHKRQ